jgi:hypothetical protein
MLRSAPTTNTAKSKHPNHHHHHNLFPTITSPNNHIHKIQPHLPPSTMVNKNLAFPPLSAKQRKAKIGTVSILAHIRYVTLYPSDRFVCPWCGVTASSQGAMKKHWNSCKPLLLENSEQEPLRLVSQIVVEPISKKKSKSGKFSHNQSMKKQSSKKKKVSIIFRRFNLSTFGRFLFWILRLSNASPHLLLLFFTRLLLLLTANPMMTTPARTTTTRRRLMLLLPHPKNVEAAKTRK